MTYTVEQIILIIGTCTSPFLAEWNIYQGNKIKTLELQYENLCSQCIYDFTPKNKEKLAQAS